MSEAPPEGGRVTRGCDCRSKGVGTPIDMLLLLGIILLIIAIAGGAIVHPILFALAIVAIVLFFMNRRGAAV